MAGKIMTWNGKVLFRRKHGNRIAVGKACCCAEGSCADANPNTSQQGASATVSGSDCSCTTGTHDGTYPFDNYDALAEKWEWAGTSTCDLGGFGSLADVSIFAWCDAASGQWKVRAEFYHFPNSGPSEFLDGEALAPNVSIDAAGDFTGSVDIDMYNVSDDNRCSITVTFT